MTVFLRVTVLDYVVNENFDSENLTTEWPSQAVPFLIKIMVTVVWVTSSLYKRTSVMSNKATTNLRCTHLFSDLQTHYGAKIVYCYTNTNLVYFHKPTRRLGLRKLISVVRSFVFVLRVPWVKFYKNIFVETNLHDPQSHYPSPINWKGRSKSLWGVGV